MCNCTRCNNGWVLRAKSTHINMIHGTNAIVLVCCLAVQKSTLIHWNLLLWFWFSIAGGLLSYFRGLLGTREMRILILGLDGAGKTTILYRLQVGEVVTTIPTIGFNVEQVTYKNLKFQVWDLGGQTSIRPYWRCYYSNTDAIIYVVDSADRDRIGISKDELLYMLRVSVFSSCWEQ